MTRWIVAVDVGGTSIKSALVDADGHVSHEQAEPTPIESGSAVVVERVRAITETLANEAGVVGVGIVVPGVVDAARGIATFSANLGWRDVPLRALITGDTGLPVALEHDVRAAGMADSALGSSRDQANSLVVVIGTGVAAVVRVDGKIVTGASGVAGELGHVSVDPDGELCPCGQRGCLERYASAAAITRRYAAAGGAPDTPARHIASQMLVDPIAAQIWNDAVAALATGLAAATMLLDPGVIVIAGGLSEASEALLEPLRTAMEQRVAWRPPPPIVRSTLGARAGLLGAGVVGWRMLNPFS